MSKKQREIPKIDLRMMETEDERLKPLVEQAKKLMSRGSVHDSLQAMLMGYQLQQWGFRELARVIGGSGVMADLLLHHVQQAAHQNFHEENLREELNDRVLSFMDKQIKNHKAADKKRRLRKEKVDGNGKDIRGDAADAAPDIREEDRGAESPRVIQEARDDRQVPPRGVDEASSGSDGTPAGEPG